VSWASPIEGDDPRAHTLVRYGFHVEGFFKVTRDFEIGGYHAQSFEPQIAGDPFTTPRAWAVETGIVARSLVWK
jgi:hypothetical protein